MTKLIQNPVQVSENHFLLKFNMPGKNSIPGQFINIEVDKNGPILRRPFSIFDQKNDIIEIIIRVIGKGTKILSEKKTGEIDILGPLGSGFSIEKNKKVLIVGGGVGNAPLYYLARLLKVFNNKITFIYGHRSKDLVYLKNEFETVSHKFILTTDDGSAGEKGFTTDIVRTLIKDTGFDRVYTCGPEQMMGEIVKIINGKIPIEVSIENYFGCGIGVCSGCTVETTTGLKRVCVHGPVFNGKKIVWNNII